MMARSWTSLFAMRFVKLESAMLRDSTYISSRISFFRMIACSQISLSLRRSCSRWRGGCCEYGGGGCSSRPRSVAKTSV